MIPDEAVEAAARAYQSALEGTGQPLWDDLPQERRDTRMRWAREALEAAAPHLEQAAYNRGWGAGFRHTQEAMTHIQRQKEDAS